MSLCITTSNAAAFFVYESSTCLILHSINAFYIELSSTITYAWFPSKNILFSKQLTNKILGAAFEEKLQS